MSHYGSVAEAVVSITRKLSEIEFHENIFPLRYILAKCDQFKAERQRHQLQTMIAIASTHQGTLSSNPQMRHHNQIFLGTVTFAICPHVRHFSRAISKLLQPSAFLAHVDESALPLDTKTFCLFGISSPLQHVLGSQKRCPKLG